MIKLSSSFWLIVFSFSSNSINFCFYLLSISYILLFNNELKLAPFCILAINSSFLVSSYSFSTSLNFTSKASFIFIWFFDFVVNSSYSIFIKLYLFIWSHNSTSASVLNFSYLLFSVFKSLISLVNCLHSFLITSNSISEFFFKSIHLLYSSCKY